MTPPGRRPDPVFALPTPLLFAHRGGAKEVEESTARGFTHAVNVGTDVLELDVHALKNGAQREIVVWHGPELSNVRIDALAGDKATHPGRRSDDENDIRKCDWQALRSAAWVAHPDLCAAPLETRDLSNAPQSDDRMLLTLEELLQRFPDRPVNVELKDSFGLGADVEQVVDILDRHAGGRTILVVSLNPLLMHAFRKRCADRYPTGFSLLGATEAMLQNLLPFNPFPEMDHHRALQTTHSAKLTPAKMIRRVHDRDGAVHVFLTAFTSRFPAIDDGPGDPSPEALFEVLDRGVDGVMTDRPERVRKLIDSWLGRQAAHNA